MTEIDQEEALAAFTSMKQEKKIELLIEAIESVLGYLKGSIHMSMPPVVKARYILSAIKGE